MAVKSYVSKKSEKKAFLGNEVVHIFCQLQIQHFYKAVQRTLDNE